MVLVIYMVYASLVILCLNFAHFQMEGLWRALHTQMQICLEERKKRGSLHYWNPVYCGDFLVLFSRYFLIISSFEIDMQLKSTLKAC